MWLIKKDKDEIYWVGYFKPTGKFYQHDRHKGLIEAEEHCHFLNGGVGREPEKK